MVSFQVLNECIYIVFGYTLKLVSSYGQLVVYDNSLPLNKTKTGKRGYGKEKKL